MADFWLTAAVAEELHGGEDEREKAGRKTAERQHQREPARVGMWALTAYSTEDCKGRQGGEDSDTEDRQAGAEKFSCVWLHKDRE
jgi:hypothetical protein